MPESGNVTYLDTPLGVEDASWILDIVQASHKWELIARALKLPDHEIRNCRSTDNKQSLDNVIVFWLKRDANTSRRITIKTLLAALRSKLVEEKRIAQQLENASKQSSFIPKPKASNSDFFLTNQSCHIQVTDGKSTLLHVQANLRESVCYQWKKDGQPLANSSTYCGVNEDILLVSHASQGTEGEYTCCVSCRGSEKCSNTITLTLLYPPAKKRLLGGYSTKSEVSQDSWPPKGTKFFINLTVVKYNSEVDKPNISATILDEKIQVNYSELYEEYKPRTLFVMKGRPGCGKTTLTNKIVKDWCSGNMIRNAKYVFLITLRVINRHTEQETLFSILKSLHLSEEELRKVCEEIEAANGEGVCFIIDGLDEYHTQDGDNSLIYQLLDKTFLPLAMIIVTSRPVAIASIRKEVVTHNVEVLGFTKDQILEYIDSFPFDNSSYDPAELKEFLSEHPNVFNMCYLPVHTAMICYLFNRNGNIPNTQTKIFQEFTHSTILRHMRRSNSEPQVSSLQDLRGSTKEHFDKVCQLAYQMTISGKQVATSEMMNELCEYTSNNSDEQCLGLVTINHIAELSGITKTYSFLHLTIQEFLTALYLTILDQEKLIEMVSKYKLHTSTILKFYYGIMQFQEVSELEWLSQVSLNLISRCHCAFESQQQIVCDEVGRCCEGKYDIEDPTLYDLYALSYVIRKTTRPVSDINISTHTFQHNGNNDCDYSAFLQRISDKDFSSLLSLCLDKKLNNTETLALSSVLKSCVSLQSTTLSFDEISHDSAKAISNIFKYLVKLQLVTFKCYSTSGGITTLLSGLTQLTDLSTLKLELYDMDSSGALELGNGFKFPNRLHQLILKQCSINNDEATASNPHMPHNGVSCGRVITILNDLHRLTHLMILDVSHNNIGCDGASALANQLPYLAQMQEIHLSYNNIGPSGAVSLAGTLHNLTELKVLDLSYNNIDLNSAKQVIEACKCLSDSSYIYLNTDPINVYKTGIHVEGLVPRGDNTTISKLLAATKHPTRHTYRNLHLGHESYCISPVKKQSTIYI